MLDNTPNTLLDAVQAHAQGDTIGSDSTDHDVDMGMFGVEMCYRALAFKTGGRVHLRSRNDNDFNTRYPRLVKALASMPDETVVDREVVALDADGRPSFNTLQNYGSGIAPLHFFIFDLLVLKGRI